jgi:hypothetical protein
VGPKNIQILKTKKFLYPLLPFSHIKEISFGGARTFLFPKFVFDFGPPLSLYGMLNSDFFGNDGAFTFGTQKLLEFCGNNLKIYVCIEFLTKK